MRPDHLEIVAVGVLGLGRRNAADIGAPLGAEIDAARVDHQRAIGPALLRLEHEDAALARAHGDLDAEPARDPRRARGARRVDESAAADPLAAREPDAGDPRALALDLDDLVLAIDDAEAARLAAERLQQEIAVEPALAAEAERAERDALNAQKRKARLNLVGESSAISAPSRCCTTWFSRKTCAPASLAR